MVCSETVMLQHAKKFFEVLLKKVHCFSSFLLNYIRLLNDKFQILSNQCLGCPQNGISRCTESSNLSGEKFSLSSTVTKTRRLVRFQVSFDDWLQI